MIDRLEDVETRRVGWFLAVTFAVSWLVGAVLLLLSSSDSVPRILGVPVTAALIPLGFMSGPAVGHVVARTVTDEGWSLDAAFLRPRIRRGWRYWALAWFLPAVLTLVGTGLYFLVFPGQFGGLAAVADSLAAQAGGSVAVDPVQYLAVTLVAAVTVAIPVNVLLGAFGEEFGWRGYLLEKLLPLGPRRAVLALGVIWGVWHWPLTAVGHNYGLDYPFAPVPGMLAMLWFTTVVGTVLAWLALRGGSVWPAAIAHAGLNAIAGIGIRFASESPHLLLGPTPAGLVGSIPFALLAAWILLDEDRLAPPAGTGQDSGNDPDAGGATPAATVDGPGAAGSAVAAEDDAGR